MLGPGVIIGVRGSVLGSGVRIEVMGLVQWLASGVSIGVRGWGHGEYVILGR